MVFEGLTFAEKIKNSRHKLWHGGNTHCLA